MNTVILRHPTLPDDQEIEVDAAALPHYTGAGWQQVPAEEIEHRVALKAQAEAEAAAAEEEAPAEPEDQPDDSEPAESTTRPARSRRAHEKKAEES